MSPLPARGRVMGGPMARETREGNTEEESGGEYICKEKSSSPKRAPKAGRTQEEIFPLPPIKGVVWHSTFYGIWTTKGDSWRFCHAQMFSMVEILTAHNVQE
ncbi:hypothetical protein MRB53_029566 [Persea americana]|uniref:Uncharacterized protein n=1 Tax=Persea americana TaxID=3435 RepID=A0ACC2KJ41_PERAE|nr:hypothetical protein MRB53_029566 [Persea americana]